LDEEIMSKKILILGSNGMLGQMVEKYFSGKDYAVSSYNERFTYKNRIQYGEFIRSLRDEIVINCIGRIRQKTTNLEELLEANTVLPTELRNSLAESVILIHPSTDCIFSGENGAPYAVNHLSDANDDYGWTKKLSEVALTGRGNTLVVRVSIIGPDRNRPGKGLMAWVMSHKAGEEINGFTNHLWNGITTLEWCKQIESFLGKHDQFPFQLIQYGTVDHHSKYDMLNMFNEVYKLGLRVLPTAPLPGIDRRLVPEFICKPLGQQLEELRGF
jgi:dTDP-4-dehydrorhamnose reductase